MAEYILTSVVDRLSDLLEGPEGEDMEENVRKYVQDMHSKWKKIRNSLETTSETRSLRLLLQLDRYAGLMAKADDTAIEMSGLLDEVDEWRANMILKKAKVSDLFLHHQLVRSSSAFSRFRSNSCLSLLGCGRQRSSTATDIALKVSEIFDDSERAWEDSGEMTESNLTRHIAENTMVDRDEEVECLRKKIVSLSNEKDMQVKVLCILGGSRIGKTAIAKKLYYEVEDEFDATAWATMPSGCFDAKAIGSNIPQASVGGKALDELECFTGKRSLLVIDGLEDVENSEWMLFIKSVLKNGAPGCVILVTTRSASVAREIQSDHAHSLSPLSTMGCYQVLKLRLAKFHGNMKLPPSKEKILWKIAEKCKGLPESAENYGARLADLSPDNWKQLLDTDISSIAWIRDVSFIKHLIDAYETLSPQLKRCISCCVIFRKDVVVSVDQLVRLWMAKGYLHPTSPGEEGDDHGHGDKSMEKRGIRYFNVLARCSFFKELVISSIHTNKVTGCKMDDHFHQFALHMILHGTGWCGYGIFTTLPDNAALRWKSCLVYSDSRLLPRCSPDELKYMRALVLSYSCLDRFPPEMQNLCLLQYLVLSGNPLRQLPEAVCKWYSLKFLDLSFCYFLSALPAWIGDLQSLEHLRVNHTTDELHSLPKEFEKLTLIRTMDVFRVGSGIYKSNVDKLKLLNNLEEVCIAVHGEVDFPKADMGSKSGMENLEICFAREGRDKKKAYSIMRRFKPPQSLNMLKLKDYAGIRLPRWIQARSLVKFLTRLSLTSAINITSFPSLWKLSYLEFLWLYDIPSLKHLGREFFGLPKTLEKHSEDENPKAAWSFLGEAADEDLSDYSDDDGEFVVPPVVERLTEAFASLEVLRFEYLENWKIWEDADADDEEKFNQQISVMPSLEELIIADCPKLKILPNRILRRLTSLKIQVDDPDIKIPARDQPSSSRGKEIATELEEM